MAGAEFSWIELITALTVAIVGSAVVVAGAIWTAHRSFERNVEQERQSWLFAVLAELNLNLREVEQMRASPSHMFPLERTALDQSLSHLGFLPPQVGVTIQRAALFIRRYNATTPLDAAALADVVVPLNEAIAAIARFCAGREIPSPRVPIGRPVAPMGEIHTAIAEHPAAQRSPGA